MILENGLEKEKKFAYTIKIDIHGSKPLISRRVRVKSNITFKAFHQIIQILFQWSGGHLHEFEVGNHTVIYNSDDKYRESYLHVKEIPEKKVKLDDILVNVGDEVKYIYDLGDYWVHDVKLIEIEELKENMVLPEMLEARNQPPYDDCGGIFIWNEIYSILSKKDKNDPRYLEYKELYGELPLETMTFEDFEYINFTLQDKSRKKSKVDPKIEEKLLIKNIKTSTSGIKDKFLEEILNFPNIEEILKREVEKLLKKTKQTLVNNSEYFENILLILGSFQNSENFTVFSKLFDIPNITLERAIGGIDEYMYLPFVNSCRNDIKKLSTLVESYSGKDFLDKYLAFSILEAIIQIYHLDTEESKEYKENVLKELLLSEKLSENTRALFAYQLVTCYTKEFSKEYLFKIVEKLNNQEVIEVDSFKDCAVKFKKVKEMDIKKIMKDIESAYDVDLTYFDI